MPVYIIKYYFMNKLLQLVTTGIIVKLLHSLHITWYSSRITYILVGKFKIDVFDTFLTATVALFLLYMVIKAPKLKGKPKNAYLIVKVIFHVSSLTYICYEGIYTHNYHRMTVSLIIYGLIELIIYIIHHINDDDNKGKVKLLVETTKTQNNS